MTRLLFLSSLLLVGAFNATEAQETDEDDGIEVSEEEEDPASDDSTMPAGHTTPEQAIDAGLNWLKAGIERWGRGPDASKAFGPVVLATYALAECGVPRKDRTLSAQLEWIAEELRRDRKAESQTLAFRTYNNAALILVLTSVNKEKGRRSRSRNRRRPPRGSRFDKREWKLMNEAVLRLTTGKRGRDSIPAGQNRDGGWGYVRPGESNIAATHFALLALRSASRAGYPVEPEVFVNALRFLRDHHRRGFRYTRAGHRSASVHAMGIVSVSICRKELEVLGDKEYPVPEWSRALLDVRWFERLFEIEKNQSEDPSRQHHLYYLWTVAQLGAARQATEFAGIDWRTEATRHLLERQRRDGHWTDPTEVEPRRLLATSFAVLFLQQAWTPP